MTEKELKKLNRYQLLEIIIMQTEELEKVKAELEQTKEMLEKHNIELSRAGDIAQAALKISGVFEAAQSAADIYLESVKEYAGRADKIIADAKAEAEKIKEDARNIAITNILEKAKKCITDEKNETETVQIDM